MAESLTMLMHPNVSGGWTPVPLFDPTHSSFTGQLNDLTDLISNLDLVAGTPIAYLGLIVLADVSGNVHVASLSTPALPSLTHDQPLVPCNVVPSFSLHSFPSFDGLQLGITAIGITREPLVPTKAGKLQHVSAATTVPPITLFLGSYDLDHSPVIRIVQYDPSISATTSLPAASSNAVPTHPFQHVRDLRISLPASSTLNLLSLGRASSHSSHHPLGHITHICLGPNPNPCLLVAFSSSALVLLKGDVIRDRSYKQIVLRDPSHTHHTPVEPVTGVVYSGSHFFFTTKSSICFVNSRDQVEFLDNHVGSLVAPIPFPAHVGEFGDHHLKSKAANTNQILVVQNNNLAVYCSESRKNQTYAMNLTDPIRALTWLAPWLDGYLAVITRDPEFSRESLHIVHLEHKLLAYSSKHATILCIGSCPGNNVVMIAENDHHSPNQRYTSSDPKSPAILRVKEKPILLKVQELIKGASPQFAVALAIADKARLSGMARADLHGAYGTYLLDKSGDHGGALEQFIATIGAWPASRVIRVLAGRPSAQPQLIAYLQTLHARGMASPEYTELLFRALIRGNDITGLNNLVLGELPFDVNVACACLVQGEMVQLAVDVAIRHEFRDLAIGILTFRVHDYVRAIQLIQGSVQVQRDLLVKFGNVLVEHEPELVAKVAVHVIQSAVIHAMVDLALVRDITGIFSHVRTGYSAGANVFRFITCECLETRGVADVQIWNEAVDQCLLAEDALTIIRQPECKAHLDHVLMTAKNRQWLAVQMHIHLSNGNILGMMDAQLELGSKDLDHLIQIAQQHAPMDRAVWTKLLVHATESQQQLPTSTDEPQQTLTDTDKLHAILKYIDEHSILSPIDMLRELSRNPHIRFGLVRDLFAGRVSKDRKLITENNTLIETYRTETKRMQDEIRQIETEPIVFQGTSCFACSTPLGLPAVHFYCKHSFHIRCLNNNSQQCPKCFREHQKVVTIKKILESKADKEEFYSQLSNAQDGFGLVSEWFSRKQIR